MLWPLNQVAFISSLNVTQPKKSIDIEPFIYERLPLVPFQCFKLQSKRNETSNTFSWEMPNEFARIVGIIFHEILQHIGKVGIEQWSLGQWHENKPFYQKRLCQWQLNAKEIDKAIKLIDKSIKSLIKDSRACWLLSNKHQLVQQEYALSTKSNGKLINIIIDRTFVDNNIRWIIDYKTTQHSDNKLEKYKTQLQLYQSVMEKFDAIHPIKTGVYFPLNCEWIAF